MHSHSDRLIATCLVCQQSIKDISESGKELNRLGTWNIPMKMKDKVEYKIWEANK